MTTYRKADGTPLSREELKSKTSHYNRLEGARKAQVTKADNAGLLLPTMHGGMTATQYVHNVDMMNHLRPVEYTWQAHPHSHFGRIDLDAAEATC